jgi:tetratricopeptide (TPR) repeat protein
MARKGIRRQPQTAPVAREMRIPGTLLSACMVAGLLLLYSGSYGFPLLFDDSLINPPVLEDQLRAWMTFSARWLSYGTFGLNYLASGLDIYWYRVANVVLHACTAIACYFFLAEVLRAAGPAKNARCDPDLAAACAATVFALHPVAVYAVSYLAQRSTVMATLFCLLSLRCFVRGLRENGPRNLWLAALLYFLALSSKEHAVMLPAVALTLALALQPPSHALLRRLLWLTIGFALIALLFAAKLRGVIGSTYEPYSKVLLDSMGGAAAPGGPPIAGRDAYFASVFTQMALFFRYIAIWVVPYPEWMSVDYRVSIAALPPALPYWIATAGYAGWGVVGLLLVLKRGNPGLAGAAMLAPWFLFMTEFATIRVQEPFVLYRSYLWAIGLPLALALLARRLAPRALLLVAALCVALALATRERIDTFSSPLKLWDDAVRKNPDLSMPFVDRALVNRAVARLQSDQFSGALEDLDLAIRLNPQNSHAWINRAAVHSRRGELGPALEDAARALELSPQFAEAYAERCGIWIKAQDESRALEDCNEALRLSPLYPPALLNRGVLLAKTAHTTEALADFETLLRYAPGNPIALFNRGVALDQAGRREDALQSLQASCKSGFAAACDLLRK